MAVSAAYSGSYPSLTPKTAYFVIAEPSNGKQWANGATNPVQWTKGLLDGVSSFDIELARSNKDGILYLARDGTSTATELVTIYQIYAQYLQPPIRSTCT